MEIELPVLTAAPADLVSDAVVTRSVAPEQEPPVRDRVTIGVPVGIVLDESAVTDPELRAFVTAERSAARYVLFHFSMSLGRDDEAPLTRAWLAVALTREDGASAPAVIAWSMSPLRETRDTSTVTRSVELGPKLQLLSANFTAQTTATRREVVIEGTGLQESTPSWELAPPKGEALSGSYPFTLVARSPAAQPIVATVSVMASVRRRRLLRAYHAELPAGAPLSVTV
jgi:hypothetical protein